MGALALMLHFMFDQGGLVGKVPGWDWANASSWHEVCVDLGKCLFMCSQWYCQSGPLMFGWCHETTTRGATRLESVVLGVELCIAR